MLTDDEIRAALKRAFSLGQTYWQQADSDSYAQNRRADDTRAKFDQLVTVTALAAAPQDEPVAFHELLREAEAEVRAKPVWKRYIDGTPLANDVPVWMAVFAQHHARTIAPPAPAPQPSADPWRSTVEQMLATTEQTASDDPRESIDRLISWHVSVALDPLVSSDARALVQRGRGEVAAQLSAEPIVWECQAGGLKPLSQRLYDAQPDDIKRHYTRMQPPSELVRAARDAADVLDGAVRGYRSHDPAEVRDALRRALDATAPPATVKSSLTVPDAIPETGEARDAARYRWLRDTPATQARLDIRQWLWSRPGGAWTMDQIIDSAMGDAPEAKGEPT